MPVAASMLAVLPVRHAGAHAGDLDPTFGDGGIVILPNLRPEAPFDTARALAIQPDGKIAVVGRWGAATPGPTFAVARFNPDGTLDGGFGFNGLVTLSSGYAGGDEAHAVAITHDGKLVVGGNFGDHAGIYRLARDGALDTSFGSGGAVVVDASGGTRTTLNALAMDGSGGTLLAGVSSGGGPARYVLGWLATDGTIITISRVSLGFGDLDQVATSLARQADGKLVVAGYADLGDQVDWGQTYCAVARFQPAAFPDVGFFPDPAYGDGGGPTRFFGIGSPSQESGCYADALALLPDGSTLPAGRESLPGGGWTGVDVRLDTSGQIDSGFGGTPQFSAWGDNSIRAVVVQTDGKPLLVGFTGVDDSAAPGPFAMRLKTNGQPDTGYGSNGETLIDFDPRDYASGQAFGAAVDAQGRVVIAGTYFNGGFGEDGQDFSQIFLARLQADTSDLIFKDGFDP